MSVDMLKAQFQSLVQYDDSEGPTKADNGEDDPNVVNRADVRLTGWVNPLGVTDAGDGDDLILAQTQYDVSEGPTKADNGESEETVVLRESDTGNGKKFSGWTNPLGWSDSGEDDDSVV